MARSPCPSSCPPSWAAINPEAPVDFLVMDSKYAALGRDLLTWLYQRVQEGEGQLEELSGAELFFDDALALVGEGDRPAASTFRGDPLSMERELMAALRSGKKIARAKLHLIAPDGDFAFTLDTDTWALRGLKVPGSAAGSDGEAVILDRLGLLERVEQLLEPVLLRYLRMRTDPAAYEAWGRALAAWVVKAG